MSVVGRWLFVVWLLRVVVGGVWCVACCVLLVVGCGSCVCSWFALRCMLLIVDGVRLVVCCVSCVV